jgi:hypothetical protein
VGVVRGLGGQTTAEQVHAGCDPETEMRRLLMFASEVVAGRPGAIVAKVVQTGWRTRFTLAPLEEEPRPPRVHRARKALIDQGHAVVELGALTKVCQTTAPAIAIPGCRSPLCLPLMCLDLASSRSGRRRAS